jgi:hypothetical protein
MRANSTLEESLRSALPRLISIGYAQRKKALMRMRFVDDSYDLTRAFS